MLTAWSDAYAAGLFDGEGCITIRRRREGRSFVLDVRVTNTHHGILVWLQQNYGGSIHGGRQPKGNRREAWTWILSSAAGAQFLRTIFPYLQIKRQQAYIAIDLGDLLAERGRGKGMVKRLTEEDIRKREAVYDRWKVVRPRAA